MKAVIAIDSLKGSLSSIEAGEAAAEGIRRVNPQAETVVCPLADGGEGTVEALVQGMGGVLQTIRVTGPPGGTCGLRLWHDRKDKNGCTGNVRRRRKREIRCIPLLMG